MNRAVLKPFEMVVTPLGYMREKRLGEQWAYQRNSLAKCG